MTSNHSNESLEIKKGVKKMTILNSVHIEIIPLFIRGGPNKGTQHDNFIILISHDY